MSRTVQVISPVRIHVVIEAKAAQIMLIEGDPNGLRTADFGPSWTGKIIASPRSSITVLKEREEVKHSGLYILTGPDPESDGSTRVYIGEGETLKERLYHHERNKEFWDSFYGVVSKNKNSELTKTNIRYLESLSINRADTVNRAILDNRTKPDQPVIQEIEKIQMDVYFRMMTTMLPLLGCNVLSPTRPIIGNEESKEVQDFDELFVIKMKNGVVANGIQNGSEFVVLEGSNASMEEGKSWVNGRKFREQLIREGALVEEGPHLRFTRDVAFKSPSAAASVVRALQTNGRYSWKEVKSGKQYVEIYGRINQ